MVTPHLGASTTEAQTAASTDVVAGILTYLRGQGLVGAVNAGGVEVNLSPQEKAYADLAERMGTILAAIAEKGFDSITLRTTGELPKRIANTLQRLAVMTLLKPFLIGILNVVNAFHLAEGRGIAIRSETARPGRKAGAAAFHRTAKSQKKSAAKPRPTASSAPSSPTISRASWASRATGWT